MTNCDNDLCIGLVHIVQKGLYRHIAVGKMVEASDALPPSVGLLLWPENISKHHTAANF